MLINEQCQRQGKADDAKETLARYHKCMKKADPLQDLCSMMCGSSIRDGGDSK